jgi:hypothetical protein
MRSANDYMERLRNKSVAAATFSQAPPESIYAQVLQGRIPFVIPTPTGTTVDPSCFCAERTVGPFLAHSILNQLIQANSNGSLNSRVTYEFQNSGLQPITVTLTRIDESLLLSPSIGPGETYTPYPNQGYVSYTTS